jgi:hypothetical protein
VISTHQTLPTGNSIAAHAADAGVVDRVRPARVLDAATADAAAWVGVTDGAPVDVVLAVHVVHIAPWAATEGLVAGAARALRRPGGALVLYGPFARGGVLVPESNVTFDARLRARSVAARGGARSRGSGTLTVHGTCRGGVRTEIRRGVCVTSTPSLLWPLPMTSPSSPTSPRPTTTAPSPFAPSIPRSHLHQHYSLYNVESMPTPPRRATNVYIMAAIRLGARRVAMATAEGRWTQVRRPT